MTAPPDSRKTILLIDDDPHLHDLSRRALEKTGYRFLATADPHTGLELIRSRQVDLVLLDFMMPQLDGYEVYKTIVTRPEFAAVRNVPVIMLTVLQEDFPKRRELMEMGLSLWLRKPFGRHELVNIIDNVFMAAELRKRADAEISRSSQAGQRIAEENAFLRTQLWEAAGFDQVIGNDPAMQHVLERVRKVAPTEASVLIHGEKGTGKELIGRVLHTHSRRAHRPFIAVDCSALPADVLEAELFGHRKGRSAKSGLLDLADGGTLFLEQIVELDAGLQEKLLRIMKEGQFHRPEEKQPIDVDIRFIAATEIDPEAAVNEGRLRQDLYYRLNIVPLYLPPLRRRRDDISLLVQHFVRRLCRKHGRPEITVSRAAMDSLVHYEWPGNVAELLNVVERMVSLASGECLDIEDLPESILQNEVSPLPSDLEDLPLTEARQKWLERFERQYLVRLLSKCRGNVTRAAKAAGVNRMTIYRRLKQYNIPHKTESIE